MGPRSGGRRRVVTRQQRQHMRVLAAPRLAGGQAARRRSWSRSMRRGLSSSEATRDGQRRWRRQRRRASSAAPLLLLLLLMLMLSGRCALLPRRSARLAPRGWRARARLLLMVMTGRPGGSASAPKGVGDPPRARARVCLSVRGVRVVYALVIEEVHARRVSSSLFCN